MTGRAPWGGHAGRGFAPGVTGLGFPFVTVGYSFRKRENFVGPGRGLAPVRRVPGVHRRRGPGACPQWCTKSKVPGVTYETSTQRVVGAPPSAAGLAILLGLLALPFLAQEEETRRRKAPAPAAAAAAAPAPRRHRSTGTPTRTRGRPTRRSADRARPVGGGLRRGEHDGGAGQGRRQGHRRDDRPGRQAPEARDKHHVDPDLRVPCHVHAGRASRWSRPA